MGGIGSGNWDRRWDSRITVEECFELDVNQLARNGLLPVGAAGSWNWEDQYGESLLTVQCSTFRSYGGERIFLISYFLDNSEDDGSEDVSIPIQLQTTQPNFGGLRWWFTCPLIVDGVPCNRRVAKLYLPPAAWYFGCRICHDLTYQSCRQSHRWERLLSPHRVERLTARVDALNERLERRLAQGSTKHCRQGSDRIATFAAARPGSRGTQ